MRSASVSPMPYIIVTEVFIPSLMRDLHDLEPAVGAGLLRRDDVAHALHEDLAAAAGDRVESRLPQLADDVSTASMRNSFAKKSTSLGLNPWMWIGWLRLDVAQQVEVPLERDVRVVPALDEDLDAAQRLRLVDLRADLLERQRVALAVLRPPVERAEAAVGDADVRVVDVPVDDVRDDAVGMPLAGARGPPRRRARGAARSCRSRADHVMAVTEKRC